MTALTWTGVDLDGCLAFHIPRSGVDTIGPPVPEMLERVKKWLAEGKRLKIFTARVDGTPEWNETQTSLIQNWLIRCGLPALEVTCKKDQYLDEYYDDRAVQVERNTGKIIGYSTRE